MNGPLPAASEGLKPALNQKGLRPNPLETFETLVRSSLKPALNQKGLRHSPLGKLKLASIIFVETCPESEGIATREEGGDGVILF